MLSAQVSWLCYMQWVISVVTNLTISHSQSVQFETSCDSNATLQKYSYVLSVYQTCYLNKYLANCAATHGV
jgi:hypothetical protein